MIEVIIIIKYNIYYLKYSLLEKQSLTNIKSAKKNVIKDKKLKKINSSRKTMLRRLIKKVYAAIIEKNKILAQNIWKQLQCILDRFSRKGLIHKNKAARHKSRLYLKIQKLS